MLSGCEAQKKLPPVEAAILGIGSGQAQKNCLRWRQLYYQAGFLLALGPMKIVLSELRFE
jgi:hypothetical protein